MKKILYFLSAFYSCLIFVVVFSQFSMEEDWIYRYPILKDQKSIVYASYSTDHSADSARLITDILNEQKAYGIFTNTVLGPNGSEISVSLYYLPEEASKAGVSYGFLDGTGGKTTSDRKESTNRKLPVLDRWNLLPDFMSYLILPWSQENAQEYLPDHSLFVYARSANLDQLEKALAEVSIPVLDVGIQDWQDLTLKESSTQSTLLILALSIFAMVAALLDLLLKQIREIIIQKQAGRSGWIIFLRWAAPILVSCCFWLIIPALLLSLTLINFSSPATGPFTLRLIQYVLLMLMGLLLVFAVFFLFICRIQLCHTASSFSLFPSLIILKTMVLIALASPVCMAVSGIGENLEDLSALKHEAAQSAQLFTNLYVPDSFVMSFSQEVSEQQKTASQALADLGVQYQFVQPVKSMNEGYDFDGLRIPAERIMAEANANYVNSLHLRAAGSEKVIEIGQNQEAWLVSQQDEQAILAANGFESSSVFVYPSDSVFYTLDPGAIDLKMKNPIIHVRSQWVWGDLTASGQGIYFAPQSQAEKLQEIYDGLDLKNLWGRVQPMNQYQTGLRKQKLLQNVLHLIVCSVVICVFQYECTFLYFEEHRRRMAVQTMAGKPFWVRYGGYFLSQIACWLSALGLCLFWFQDLPGMVHPGMVIPGQIPDYSLLVMEFFLTFGCISLLISLVFVHRMETRNAIGIMKGDF